MKHWFWADDPVAKEGRKLVLWSAVLGIIVGAIVQIFVTVLQKILTE